MGLSSSLSIGRTALSAAQLGIQVTGNNLSNASTPGYSRQLLDLGAVPDQRFGNIFVGRGVQPLSIRRSADQAIQTRLWSTLSDEAAANQNQQFLTSVGAAVNALGDTDIAADLQRFFNRWSDLANSPNPASARTLVIQQGRALAANIRATRTNLENLQAQAGEQLEAQVRQADALLSQIAAVNTEVVNAEAGTPAANTLRDRRDQLISELSQLMDVTVIEQPSGAVNIMQRSTPLVLETQNRGIELQTREMNGVRMTTINVRADNTELGISSGAISSSFANRPNSDNDILTRLDSLAKSLIFEVNKLHSTGRGSQALTSVTGTTPIDGADRALAFNDPNNRTFSNLPFKPVNGGFTVTIRNATSGASQSVRIPVDLDGITSAGTPGTTDDTSINSLQSALNSVPNLSASVGADGALNLSAAGGYTFSFSDDSSSVLAVLGINTYFVGSGSGDLDVRQALQDTPSLLATNATSGQNTVDNAIALAIAGLRDTPLTSLNGASILGAWRDAAQQAGSQASAAGTAAAASTIIRENLDAQRAAISGVDLDQETINLLDYQRMYQGAARYVSVVNELTQTLLGILQ
jgi:flagellar hook-associated protein 1